MAKKTSKKEKISSEILLFGFQALGDPTRLKIFTLLAKERNFCVTDVAKNMKISLPAVSYQMKMMEMAGLLEKERTGKTICYRLKENNPLIKQLRRLII